MIFPRFLCKVVPHVCTMNMPRLLPHLMQSGFFCIVSGHPDVPKCNFGNHPRVVVFSSRFCMCHDHAVDAALGIVWS